MQPIEEEASVYFAHTTQCHPSSQNNPPLDKILIPQPCYSKLENTESPTMPPNPRNCAPELAFQEDKIVVFDKETPELRFDKKLKSSLGI